LGADTNRFKPTSTIERLAFIEKMFQFVIPKLQAQAVKVESPNSEINIPPIRWVENDEPLEESKLFQKSIKILGLQTTIGEK
jgi:hypothetical protein